MSSISPDQILSPSPLLQKEAKIASHGLNGREVAIILAAYSEGKEIGEKTFQEITSKKTYSSILANFKEIKNPSIITSLLLKGSGYTQISGTDCYVKNIEEGISQFNKDKNTGIKTYSRSNIEKMRKTIENSMILGNSSNSSLRDYAPRNQKRLMLSKIQSFKIQLTKAKKNILNSLQQIPFQNLKRDLRILFSIVSEKNTYLLTLEKPKDFLAPSLETLKKISLGIGNVIFTLFRSITTITQPIEDTPQSEKRLNRWKTNDIRTEAKGGVNFAFDYSTQKKNSFINLDTEFTSFQSQIAKGREITSEGDNIEGISHFQGKRGSMEDTHISGSLQIFGKTVPYHGICDGHEGRGASLFIQSYFQQHIQEMFTSILEKKTGATSEEMENICSLIGVKLSEELYKYRSTLHPKIEENLEEFHRLLEKIAGRGSEETTKKEEIDRFYQNIKKSLTYGRMNESRLNTQNSKLHSVLNILSGAESSKKIDTKCEESDIRKMEYLCNEIERLGIYLNGGSTMALALHIDNHIWAVNIGDSRILAVTSDSIYQLTEDAESNNTSFKKSIEARGGKVIEDRVSGLGVARGIGENIQGLTARAKVTCFPIEKETKLILGCDGLFETLTSEQIGQFIQMNSEKSNINLSQDLIKLAFTSGSEDNISATVLSLQKKA